MDKLVIGFFITPFIPWILWLSGQDGPMPPDEVAGVIAISLVLWGIGGIVAWRAGGAIYLVEALCFALLFVPLIPWIVAALPDPFSAPRGEFLERLLVATVFSWGVAALLAWRFKLWPFEAEDTRGQLWPFEAEEARGQGHLVAVFHVDPPERDYEQYFVAICECDWLGEIHGDAESAFADARRHSPNTDAIIKRPLDADSDDGEKDSPSSS